MIKTVIPYMVLVMSTAHVYSANTLSVKWLKSVKIASFVPKLTNGKWPVCLGQNEGKFKKLAVVFPITTAKAVHWRRQGFDSWNEILFFIHEITCQNMGLQFLASGLSKSVRYLSFSIPQGETHPQTRCNLSFIDWHCSLYFLLFIGIELHLPEGLDHLIW